MYPDDQADDCNLKLLLEKPHQHLQNFLFLREVLPNHSRVPEQFLLKADPCFDHISAEFDCKQAEHLDMIFSYGKFLPVIAVLLHHKDLQGIFVEILL